MIDGIFLSRQTIQSASPAFQQELAHMITTLLGSTSLTPSGSGSVADEGQEGSPEAQASDDDGDWLPDLSIAQTRKVTDNVSEKVRTAYTFIAEAPVTGFAMTDVIKALGGTTNNDIRGVWAGITRRLRNVLDDPEAQLIHWTWSDDLDNWTGRVSAHTHKSLRKVLGLD